MSELSSEMPTFAKCCRCRQYMKGQKTVPRSADDVGDGWDERAGRRVLAGWDACVYAPGHWRPVCNKCALDYRPGKLVIVAATINGKQIGERPCVNGS